MFEMIISRSVCLPSPRRSGDLCEMNSNIDTAAAAHESWDLADRSLPALITASVPVLLFNKQQPPPRSVTNDLMSSYCD